MSQRLPYGEGVFRRRFRLAADGGRVVADLEDDFHRMRVELEHDGERVTAVRGDSRRYPWTECPAAARALEGLVGMSLSTSASAAARHTRAREHCTHLLDVACLAVTHAAAGRSRRQYDIAIPDLRDGATRATLRRDGEPLLDWELRRFRIEGPEPFRGLALRGGSEFLAFVESHLDAETGEAAMALRRACFIAMGRAQDLDAAPDAGSYLGVARGNCRTFTPGIAEQAKRVPGTSLDFTHRPEALLGDLDP